MCILRQQHATEKTNVVSVGTKCIDYDWLLILGWFQWVPSFKTPPCDSKRSSVARTLLVEELIKGMTFAWFQPPIISPDLRKVSTLLCAQCSHFQFFRGFITLMQPSPSIMPCLGRPKQRQVHAKGRCNRTKGSGALPGPQHATGGWGSTVGWPKKESTCLLQPCCKPLQVSIQPRELWLYTYLQLHIQA